MSKNTSNMLFETCWIPCKKPHFSTWSRSRYTFFWMTRYIQTERQGRQAGRQLWLTIHQNLRILAKLLEAVNHCQSGGATSRLTSFGSAEAKRVEATMETYRAPNSECTSFVAWYLRSIWPWFCALPSTPPPSATPRNPSSIGTRRIDAASVGVVKDIS